MQRAGQSAHWKTVHRHMCKTLNKSLSSSSFQGLMQHERLDALLLSHLLATHHKFLKNSPSPKNEKLELLDVFLDLLPHDQPPATPPVVEMNFARFPQNTVDAIYSRFSNNNFVIHSHLDQVGHGIFPLASRLFNHSCAPNAIMAFTFEDNGQPPRMLVRALRDIKDGEEITVPYFDPALPYQRRQEICQFSYGFVCRCPLCEFSKRIVPISEPPKDEDKEEQATFERLLCQLAFSNSNSATIDWPRAPLLPSLPGQLTPIFHEDYLPRLSKRFRDAAHDGPYDLALTKGMALLAAYMIIYPPYYPQTGTHLLELAKTAWNMTISDQVTKEGEADMLKSSRRFLELASQTLAILGKEGDEGYGPAADCAALRALLES
ncbi:hypothetical protein SCHPADRAFT_937655 [Schizopora paradoxa]|uniref:SET domain-containing protein n=1 Tax=Schizopora paradoxa TaxID=27342 RepID=A0A0H2S540_9AGAM|nr:hypothetical protein SCHPADRAFT_937655 [Schizopora paradoxa]